MGRSSGPGSPLRFLCTRARRLRNWRTGFVPSGHDVKLTGRERPHRHVGHSIVGRSTLVSREYVCACGHRGWSNHRDLEQLAARDKQLGALLVSLDEWDGERTGKKT